MGIMLFFDLDGPILDVSERYYSVYNICVRQLGGEPLDKYEYWDEKRANVPEREIVGRSLDEKQVDRYLTARMELIEESGFLRLDRVWEELSRTYPKLFLAHPATVVTLRTNDDSLGEQLRCLGIDSWFRNVLSWPNTGQVDNRWQIKVEMIEKSGLLDSLDPRDCVFVGDTETDILAGRHFGMKTLAVAFGIRSRELLVPCQPDEIFDSPDAFSAYLRTVFL
jgi:phosphoglycolate phosphatase-like HAD superfamily hydrolase